MGGFSSVLVCAVELSEEPPTSLVNLIPDFAMNNLSPFEELKQQLHADQSIDQNDAACLLV